ncbi:MAG: type II secretion system protein [Clostridia bacterium]|nr:type II secretion system protein [Clostridia bacterium]
MLKMNNEKGVTMIVLVITIVVLLILSGIAIIYGIQDSEFATEKKQLSELEMVATAVHEQYIKYEKTGTQKFLVGEQNYNLSDSITEDFNGKSVSSISNSGWYRLNEDDLEKIGIQDSKYEYAVKYETGEVYNITVKKTKKNNKTLYIKLGK